MGTRSIVVIRYHIHTHTHIHNVYARRKKTRSRLDRGILTVTTMGIYMCAGTSKANY